MSESAEQSALFFASHIKPFKDKIRDLSKKELQRLIYAMTVHPLQEEYEAIITSKTEEEMLNLHIALLNAKLVMFAETAEQKEKENGSTREEKSTEGGSSNQE